MTHAQLTDTAIDTALDKIDAGPRETKAHGVVPRSRQVPSDTVKEAVVEIGRELLKQGQMIKAIAGNPGTPRSARDARLHAHHVYKGALDEVHRLRKSGRTDPLILAKLSRIDRDLDRLGSLQRRAEVKADRPPWLGGDRSRHSFKSHDSRIGSYLSSPAAVAYRAATNHWLKTGSTTYRGMAIRDLAIAAKAMHTELSPEGGYIVLPQHENSPLMTFLRELSPMRQEATVKTITTGELIQPTILSSGQAEWASERQTVGETDTPTIGEDRISVFELRANPKVTQVLLDDASIDLESFLAQECGTRFAERESEAFISGTGVTQPRGLLTYPFVTDHSTWEHGKFRLIETGVSGAFPATNPAGSPPTMPDNVLIDVTSSVKKANRANATWRFNRNTAAVIRKMRDVDGRPLWQPSTQLGQPDMLMAYGVSEDEYMPDIGADTVAIGFGDWKKTYLIVDRIGVTVLRDPYTVEGHVVFKTRKRVGGGAQYFDAAIFLRFGT